jgi:hypothetical protein
MIDFAKYFSAGLKSTLRLLNGTNFSYKGPWVLVYPDTVVDSWYVGDFSSAEYTLSVDLDTNDKEIVKCIVVAGPSIASVNVFGRSNLGQNLIDVTATVNNSKVTLIVSPSIPGVNGSKLIFSATYYHTINPLVP